jgi:hypothetical protein
MGQNHAWPGETFITVDKGETRVLIHLRPERSGEFKVSVPPFWCRLNLEE